MGEMDNEKATNLLNELAETALERDMLLEQVELLKEEVQRQLDEILVNEEIEIFLKEET